MFDYKPEFGELDTIWFKMCELFRRYLQCEHCFSSDCPFEYLNIAIIQMICINTSRTRSRKHTRVFQISKNTKEKNLTCLHRVSFMR